MIEVKRLTKDFGVRRAVDDVSFTVEKGEILGFMGPNGAGKSTTMRMVTGYLPPTSGTASIGGCDIVEDTLAARRRIGYLPENAPVYRDMTVSGFLHFIAEIRGFTGTQGRRKVDETLEKCFLEQVRNQTIGTLSKGYKQRVCFAQSILHDPEYLIFDEPTDGLDPNQKHEVRQMIRNMSRKKVIILSTHILDEVDAVCSRVIIIAGGRIAADDTPDRLRARSPFHGAVSVSVAGDRPRLLAEGLAGLAGIRSAEVVEESSGPRLRVFPERPDEPIADRILSFLREQNAEVRSLFVERGRLDSVFRDITAPTAEDRPAEPT